MKPRPTSDPAALRQAAEARLQARPAASRPQTEADLRRLQHELEIHQIELEMENEELRAAHAQIADTLERYTDLFDFAPVGYIDLTADSTIQLVNLTAAKLVGLERTRLVGRRLAWFIAEPDRAAFSSFLKQVFATGDRQTREIALLKEGRPPLPVRLEATLSPDGKECRALLIDLAETRQVEDALRASEEMFSKAFRFSPDAIALWRLSDGLIADVNEAFERASGWQREELIGHSGWESNLWVRREDRDRYVAAVAERRRFVPFEAEFRVKSGAHRVGLVAGEILELGGEAHALAIIHDITERKQSEAAAQRLLQETVRARAALISILEDQRAAEAALRESEERLRLAVRASNVGFWDWDLKTNQASYSREWKSQLGYEEHEIGSEFSEWERRVHPGDLAPTLARIQRSLADPERAHEAEFRMRHKDGSWRWIYTRAEVVRNADGKPERMLGCHLEITQRKQAEAIRETMLSLETRLSAASTPEEAARSIFAAADQLWDWDAGALDLYSPAEDRMWAVMYFDIVDGKRREVVPDRDAAQPTVRARRIMRDGPELILRALPYTQMSDSMVFGDKSRFSASILSVPIRSQSQTAGVLSIQSYTPNAFTEADLKLLQALADHCGGTLERLRATEALRASEERLRTVVESIDELVWVAEPGRIDATYLSPAFEKIWGRSIASVMGQPEQLLQTVQPEDRPCLLAALARQAAGQPTDIEYRILRPDGGVRWIWDRAVPVRDASGRLASVNGIAMDITQRKQAEALIQAQKQVLEMIATGVPLAESLAALLRLMEAQSSDMLCSILLLNADGVHLGHCAALNLPDEYCRAIDGVAIGPSVGSCGTAAFRREPVIVEDIATDPLWADYRDLAMRHGLRACWSTPIFDAQRCVLGTFAIYYRQPALPTARHLQLVEMATNIAAIAISKEREDAALQEREEQLRLFVRHSPAALAMFDRDMRYLVASRRWLSDYRLGEPEIIGRGHYEVFPEIPERWKEIHRRCLAGATERCEEDPFPRADGTTDWVRWEIRPWWKAQGDIGGIIMFTEVITARKQTADALRESQARTQLLVKSSNIGLWDWNLLTNEAFFSAEWKRHLGYADHELPNRYEEWESRLHPEDRPPTLAAVNDFCEGRRSDYDVEFRLRHKNGSWRWILARADLIRDASGLPARMMGCHIDIAERKQAEEDLRRSQFKLEGIIHSVDGIFWEADAQTFQFTFVSAQAERILGYPVARWLSEPTFWKDHLHPEDRDAAVEYCLAATARLEAHQFEYRMGTADGRVVWLKDIVTVIAENGRPVKLLGILVDITEIKHAEATLRESGERLRLAVQASNVGLWDWDLRTNQVIYSREWKSQLGYEEHEIANEFGEWERRVHPADLAPTLERMQRYQARPEGAHEAEFRMRHKDGSWRWIYTRAEVFRDANGTPARMSGCHLDITERKQAEAIQKTMLLLETRLSTVSTPTEAAQVIFEAADQLWDWDAGALDVYSPEEDRIWAVMYFDIIDGKRREVAPRKDSAKPTARVRRIMRDGPELIRRTRSNPELLDAVAFGDSSRMSAAILCAPIRSQGQPTGVLSIHSYTPNAFTESDVKLLQALADHCGGTLERIRATVALRASEERLRTVVESIDELVWVAEPGRMGATYLSPAFEKIWGRSVAVVVGQSEQFLQTVLDEDRPCFLAALARQAAGQPTNIEYRIVRPDGGVRWIWDRAAPMRNAAGRLAAVNGIAMDITERKQAEAELRELSGRLLRVQDEERRRIARELHDTTAQNLAALAMNLSVVRQTPAGDAARTARLLDDCERLVERSVREIRTVSYLLHPPLLDELGLPRALREYAEGFAQRSGIRVELELDDSLGRFPREAELAFFRVLQESLGNVLRHSGSATARVGLTRSAEIVTLEVQDAGRGMDATTPGGVALGVGIAGMRERLRQLGGRIEIESTSPGTCVRAILPLSFPPP